MIHGFIDVFASGRMFLIGILVILVSTDGARSARVYRWQDANGQLHYGDIPPERERVEDRTPGTDTASTAEPAGLRPGERKALRRVERREHDESLRTSRNRHRHDRQRARKRRVCGEIRKRLQGTRDQTLRKQYSNTLRRDC
jgi:hypothetical protein